MFLNPNIGNNNFNKNKKNTTKMNQKQIIKELQELVEMASFKIECEDQTQENYTVVEISDIETIIEKIKNTTK